MHPRLFQLGHLILPTYGVLLAIGLIVSLLLCRYTAGVLSLPADKVWNLAVLGIAISIGGAKILFIAQNWAHYGVRVFALNLNGGSFFWAIAIAVLACWAYASHAGLPKRRAADALAPALALGSSIAAIACLEAGCDYGTPTHMPWSVVYSSPWAPPDTPRGIPLHPTQIYSSLVEFGLFALTLWFIHRRHRDGEIIGAWLFLSGFSRFLLSYLQGETMNAGIQGSFLTLWQALAAVMVLAGGVLWLRPAEVSGGSSRREFLDPAC